MKPVISLVASAARPDDWPAFLSSLRDNSVLYEVIFVGPNPPVTRTPINFKYVQSDFKPMQCQELAARMAAGELLHGTVDDVEYAPHALDALWNFYKSKMDPKLMVGFRFRETFMESGVVAPEREDMYKLVPDIPDSPRGSILYTVSRDLYNRLGGFDRNFICGQADNDMRMRIFEVGGKFELCPHAWANIIHSKHKEGTIVRGDNHLHDNALFRDLWMESGSVLRNRKRPVELYDDATMLTTQQGPGVLTWV